VSVWANHYSEEGFSCYEEKKNVLFLFSPCSFIVALGTKDFKRKPYLATVIQLQIQDLKKLHAL